MKRILTAVFGLAFLTAVAAPARADSADDVKKKIHDKVAGLKSFMMKMKTTHDSEMEGGVSTKGESDMIWEAVKTGDKTWKSRMEMTSKMVTKMQGNEQKMDSNVLNIYDGTYSYTYSEGMGMKNAMKQKADPKTNYNPFDQMTLFKQQEPMYNYKLLADEKVEGKTCWVLELTPKDENIKKVTSKAVTWYDQATGLNVKSITYDPKGKVSSTSIVTESKTDSNIPADRFVFKAPAGVEVQDLTNMGGNTDTSDSTATEKPTTDKPADKPADKGGDKGGEKGGMKLPKNPFKKP